MTYATQTDLENAKGSDALTQLTDPNQTAIDSTKIDQALADAGSLIDSYLRGRYVVPLATVPSFIRLYAVNIAFYHLSGASEATDQDRTLYEDAIAALKDIRDGKTLLDTPAASGDGVYAGAPQFAAGERIFSQETLKDF